MTRKAFTFLAVAVLVVTAVPLMAQTIRLTANIPFEFAVGEKIMPAGEYFTWNGSGAGMLMLQDYAAHAAVLSTAQRETVNVTKDPASNTRLVFNRYGNRYFLSQVVNAYTGVGFLLPETHTERELAKTASLQREEIVAVLARR